MERSRFALLVVAAGLAGTAGAQDDEPDLSFLEYLGSWQDSDEEWLLAAEMQEELEKDEESEEDEEAEETDEE